MGFDSGRLFFSLAIMAVATCRRWTFPVAVLGILSVKKTWHGQLVKK